MARVGDIVEFLEAQALVERVFWPDAGGSRDREATGVRGDRDAGPGDLSWISPGVARKQPERLGQFTGSVLVIPPIADPASSSAVLIESRKPKLAFSLAVGRFFGSLTDVAWPAAQRAVHPSSSVSATAVLAPGVVIGAGTVVEDGVAIGPNSCIANTTIRAGASIGANCSIGLPGFGYERADGGNWIRFPHLGRIEIGAGVEIGSNVCIDRGALGDTLIASGAKIDNLVHIAHNVSVGKDALLIAHAMIGGSTTIGEGAWIAPSSSLLNQLSIGANAIIGMGAVVVRNVDAGVTVVGNPAKPLKKE